MNRFFDISPNLICILNNDGYFVKLNQVWESALGYAGEELTSRLYLDLVYPDDIEKTRSAMARLTSGHELVHFENRYLCQDGSYRWMEWNATKSRGLIYAAAHDITDRKRSERALQERLDFETLLADLSRCFVNIPPDHVDREIDITLHRISEQLDFDIAALWQWSTSMPQYLTLTNFYWRLEGVPMPERIDAEDLFPWTFRQAMAGRIVAISVDEFPPEATRDQEISRRYGIKSSLTFPLRTWNGKLIGGLSFNTMREKRTWPEDVVKRLQLVAEIFANALSRKLADIALRESEERLSLASASAEAGLWILDLETRQFWVTDKALELFGLPPGSTFNFDDFIGLVHHEDRDRVCRLVDQAPELDSDAAVEYRVIKADNSIHWMASRGRKQVHSTGEAKRLMGITQDITERKDMEHRIQKAAGEWQTTFDNIPDLVMILNTEFRIVRINAAVRTYFDRPKEEIIGTHCYTLIHEEAKPCDDCPFLKTLESKKHEEAEFYDSARKTWLLASTDPIMGDNGEVLQVIHTLRDITGLKKAEAEAFAVRKELWRTDRLLRMGELTASLAHELNQPLTSILSNARAGLRFIDSGTIDIDELKDILNDIAHDDKRAGEIIRSLRSMVKHEEGERNTVSLNDVLREAVTLFHSESVIRNIIVETRLLETLPMVNIDMVQIEQVLLNLMINAMESMPDDVRDRRITLRSEMGENRKVRVAVSDHGTGIPAEELNSVFEAFFTTKQSGLGMGLSLSRSIIEAHGGSIWAENNPDKGATFFIELPISEDGDR